MEKPVAGVVVVVVDLAVVLVLLPLTLDRVTRLGRWRGGVDELRGVDELCGGETGLVLE